MDELPPLERRTPTTEHLAVVLTLTGALFVSVRVIAAARYDFTTASAILAEAGTGSVLVATAITMAVPLTATFAVPAALLTLLAAYRFGTPTKPMAWAAAGMAVALQVALVPSELWLTVGALAAFVGYLAWRSRGGRAPGRPSALGRALDRPTFNAFAGVALALSLLTTAPWLPPERVTVRGESDPVVGYVLRETPAQLVVLRDADRRIVRYDAHDVVGRVVCRTRSLVPAGRTVASYFWPTRAPLPSCRKR